MIKYFLLLYANVFFALLTGKAIVSIIPANTFYYWPLLMAGRYVFNPGSVFRFNYAKSLDQAILLPFVSYNYKLNVFSRSEIDISPKFCSMV